MKKIIYMSILLSVFISCKKEDKKGKPTIDNTPDTIELTKVDFARTDNSEFAWFRNRHYKRIEMYLQQGNSTELMIKIIDNDNLYTKYKVISGDPSVFTLESGGGVIEKGENIVNITANSSGRAFLKVYGMNDVNDQMIISGTDDIRDTRTEIDLMISVAPIDYEPSFVKGEILQEEVEAYNNLPYEEEKLAIAKKLSIPFPSYYKLTNERNGYIAYRPPDHERNQGLCESCPFFAATGLIEAETKRRLVEEEGYPFSSYDIDLSEQEYVIKAEYDNKGEKAHTILDDMIDEDWILPLERYNIYSDTKCNYEDSDEDGCNPSSGVKLLGEYKVAGEFYSEFNDDDIENRVKRLLYIDHKAVSVSIYWPDPDEEGRNWDCIIGSEKWKKDEDGDKVRHCVNIIGWIDNYVTADGKGGFDVWIIQNSHLGRPKLYLRMGEGIAGERGYTYVGSIDFKNRKEFTNDLIYGNNPGGEANTRIYPTNWVEGLSTITVGSSDNIFNTEKIHSKMNYTVLLNPNKVFKNKENDLSAGQYRGVDMYKVIIRVEREGIDYQTYWPRTLGITGANPGCMSRFAFIEDKTDEFIDFATFCVYISTDIKGRSINKWIPCRPEECKVAFTYDNGSVPEWP